MEMYESDRKTTDHREHGGLLLAGEGDKPNRQFGLCEDILPFL